MKQISSLLIIASLALASGCPEKSEDNQKITYGLPAQTAIAHDWLRNNKNTSAVATNRFGSTSNAIEFVDELLQAGATQVYVVSRFYESERVAAEGGPYADELIVQLPSNPVQRAKLFEILAKELGSEGFDLPVDTGQSTETLWWD